MTDITEERNNIQEEESDFNSAISEAYSFKVGAAINFVNKRQHDSHQWIGNGPASIFTDLTGLDGAFHFLFDAEITGLAMTFANKTFTGTGLTKLEFDLRLVTTPGTTGSSIFSTLPAIDDTAPDTNSYFVYSFLTNTFETDVTGSTEPVISTSNVDAGDCLFWDITETISTVEDFALRIFYRPR